MVPLRLSRLLLVLFVLPPYSKCSNCCRTLHANIHAIWGLFIWWHSAPDGWSSQMRQEGIPLFRSCLQVLAYSHAIAHNFNLKLESEDNWAQLWCASPAGDDVTKEMNQKPWKHVTSWSDGDGEIVGSQARLCKKLLYANRMCFHQVFFWTAQYNDWFSKPPLEMHIDY